MYCIIATPSPVFLFKHVKHSTEDIQNGFLTALKCTKFVFGRGCAPNLAGGAYSDTPDHLAGLRGLLSRGGEGREREGRPLYTNFWIRL